MKNILLAVILFASCKKDTPAPQLIREPYVEMVANTRQCSGQTCNSVAIQYRVVHRELAQSITLEHSNVKVPVPVQATGIVTLHSVPSRVSFTFVIITTNGKVIRSQTYQAG
jgi:hypothetical protein